jgi:Uncharacterized protein conserved in bacteria
VPVLYYSNSNIFPGAEFDKRYENLKKVAGIYNLETVKDEWDHQAWREAVKGYESEKEHGARCPLCFRFSLSRAYQYAVSHGIPAFTTTLTVSRFKNSAVIFSVGEQFEGFEKIDFKKKNGFARSCALAAEYNLYRQNYCGCEFSLAERK